MQSPKFICIKCGKCCTRDPKSKDPSFHIRLFDFEVKKIKETLKEKKIPAEFEPAIYISDEKSKKNLVIFYQLKSKDCPFLKNNQCIIYDQRPILCRAFPIITSGLDKAKEIIKSGLCEGEKLISPKLKKENNTIRDTISTYGVNYYSAYLFEQICRKESEIIKELIQSKKLMQSNKNPKFQFIDLCDYFQKQNIDFEHNIIKELLNLNNMDEFLGVLLK